MKSMDTENSVQRYVGGGADTGAGFVGRPGGGQMSGGGPMGPGGAGMRSGGPG